MRWLTLALAACLLMPGAAAWSQENVDPANTGNRAIAAPGSLDDAQTTPMDGRVLTQVTEGPAGLALAGTLAGTVWAVDATGADVWTSDTGAELRTSPLWTGEVVVTVPRSGEAIAYTPTGEEAWTVDIGNDRDTANGDDISLVRMASPVEHPSGDILIADLEGQNQRVTPAGEVQWTYDFGGSPAVEATPAITPNGDVVAAAFTPNGNDGVLARIDGETGTTDCEDCWRVDLGAQVVAAPAITADVVLVPLRDGEALEARRLSDGGQRWQTSFDDSIAGSPTIHENLAIVGDIAGTMRAVDTSGDIVWEFNPLNQDTTDELARNRCNLLTVADSVAVDEDDVAWTPFWNANVCEGFPPRDSGESPFYRLDADTGEVLDRKRYPKANHGPSLHETGAWAGSDEGLLRHYPNPATLQLHATETEGEVTLIVNTPIDGDWSIRWGDQTRDSGDDHPPRIATQTLPAGTHEIQVQAGELTETRTVTVEAQASPSDPDPDPSTDEDSTQEPDPSNDSPPSEPADDTNTSNETDTPNGTPLSAWLVIFALALVAGRRRGA